MKNPLRLLFILGFLGLGVSFTHAGYTSVHVFGDSLSSTTGNSVSYPLSTYYYEKRYSNGRIWVEVLAQQQGLASNIVENISFFGNYSTNLLTTLATYTAPKDISTALYVVWVNNADLFDAAYYNGNDLNKWAADIQKSQNNHYLIISNLYVKGVRSLVMPNAVDLATIPFFNASVYTNIIHQQIPVYNKAFTDTLERARTNFPGLKIYIPDYFTLLNDMLAHPVNYGLTNALAGKQSIDALSDPQLADKSLNGPGANYVFWDFADPSAKVHYMMANIAQQLISPAQITRAVLLEGSNRLDLANLPLGMAGFVEVRTNLLTGNWTTNTSFTASNSVLSVFVPRDESAVTNSPASTAYIPLPEGRIPDVYNLHFYRLHFPYNWVWP